MTDQADDEKQRDRIKQLAGGADIAFYVCVPNVELQRLAPILMATNPSPDKRGLKDTAKERIDMNRRMRHPQTSSLALDDRACVARTCSEGPRFIFAHRVRAADL